MEKIISVIFLIIIVALLIIILKQLFLKTNNHFKLLKKLYPKEINNVNSFWKLMLPHNYLLLDIEIMFWYSLPFYYSKIDVKNMPKSALPYHYLLKKLNVRILIYVVVFVVSIFLLFVVTTMF